MKIRLLIALLVTSAVAAAQTKDLTPAQLLRGAPHNITQPLPRFVKWMGDKGFVLARNGKTFLVDCKTGKETEYTEVKTLEAKLINEIVVRKNDLYHKTDSGETRLTHSPDTPEQNPTLSP
ncbi:MAG TPA: hypothetical protein PKE63_05715, partial [Lacibacter sp.]|nr:hypothetical protein [Lacibacter sp.]